MRSSWNWYSAPEELRDLRGSAELAVILGSGLAPLASRTETLARVPFGRIPGFAQTSVEGHPGFVSLNTVEGERVLLIAGRFHAYEGRAIGELASPVSLAFSLGCARLIVTQAAGSLTTRLVPGTWVLASDAVFFPSTRCLDLVREAFRPSGSGDEAPERSHPRRSRRERNGAGAPERESAGVPERAGAGAPLLSKHLSEELRAAGRACGIPLVEGILCWMPGPSYETSAEGRAAAALGAEVVTMSSLPELLAAQRLSLEAAALGWVTNFTSCVAAERTEHGEVLRMGEEGARTLAMLLSAFVRGRRNA
jgi:purine-nucleoside phosphorylase